MSGLDCYGMATQNSEANMESQETLAYRLCRAGKSKKHSRQGGVSMRSFLRFALILAVSLVALSISRQTPAQAVPAAWTSIGPTNIEGRVTAVALHPTSQDLVLAAGENGGIFRSTNAGTSWELDANGKSSADELPNPAIADVQFVPSNPAVAFAGAGAGNLYKSTDSGGTWPNSPGNVVTLPDSGQVDRIRIHPTNAQIMYAVEQGAYGGLGVYRSLDGGTTWMKIKTSSTYSWAGRNDLAIDPITPSNLYAALNGAGVFKTNDGGDTWTQLNTPPSVIPTNFVEGTIAVAPSSPNVVYLAALDGDPGDPATRAGLYRSSDFGSTWALQTHNFAFDPAEPLRCCFGDMVVDPLDPTIVYFSHFYRLLKSVDSGVTLTPIPQNHPDQQSFAIQLVAPGGTRRLWAGNDGGLEKVTLANPGDMPTISDWTEIRKLPVTEFYDLAVARNNPNLVFGATQDNGVNRYTGTLDWNLSNVCGDATGVVIDPQDPNSIYARCNGGGFDESVDGGETWHGASSGLDTTNAQWEAQTAAFPGSAKTLYAGGDRVQRSAVNKAAGILQHYFTANDLAIPTGSTINQWVYIPSSTPPREIMLQFRTTDASFEHRAYWGENVIQWGTDGTPSRRFMGPIPSQRDRWIKLSVNTSALSGVDIGGRSINGLAYILQDGAINWDHTALEASGVENVWVEDGLPSGGIAYSSPPDSWTWDTGRKYSGTQSHRTTSGLAWTPISGVLQPGNGLTAVAVSSTNEKRIYAAFGYPGSGYGAYMFRTDNGGASWHAITSPAPGEFITSMAVDPTDDNVVYITLGGNGVSHVWKTIDKGVTWVDKRFLQPGVPLPDAPYNDIAISPVDRNRIVIVNGIGDVFESLNGGGTWSAAGDLSTLPNTIISGVALENGVDLTVSTYGRGMWRLPGSQP